MPSSNLVEISMPTEAILEAARARYAVRDQCFTPIVPFLNQRFAHGAAHDSS